MTVTTHLSIAYTKTKSVSRAQQNHTERFDDKHKHTNKSIDPSKSADNINLRPEYEGMSYKQRFEAIVNSDRYTGRRRKDGSAMVIEGGKNATVKMLQLSVNIGQVDEDGNPVDTLSEDDYIKLYRDDILPMLEDTFGAENIIGSAIHVDESKPHLHVDIVPLTEDGKLSAKQVVGGRGKMHQRQKQWLETMQEKRPDLNFERKKEGVKGLELDKLKELTEVAKKDADKWLNGMRAEYNSRLLILSKVKDKQDSEQVRQDNEQVRLNSWERRLKQTEQAQTDKARALAQDQARLDEALPLLDAVEAEQTQIAKQQAEKSAELDAREQAVEGRESAVARREQGIAKTVAERTEKAVGERTRALDSREQALAGKEQAFDERLTAWERAKITLVDTLQKIPSAMQSLAWWRKQSEDEDADEVADAIAEQVDTHTDKAITALADERLDEMQEHTDALSKTTDALEDGLDPEQFALSDARELPSARELAESVDIDPSQFEMPKRQLTQG
ncbi:plasmid recombination protein (plasmid) [Streptococcus salivarius]|uniref:plasmid recombination protein n=1 Tax=Streptococcus salivarius TaxID=1304 RepID=UPI001BDDFCB3|nr:plasmid recombination protein [Streptococcus salivarius]MBT2137845.1 plasmid recombination protein [Streptococcus salivarius]